MTTIALVDTVMRLRVLAPLQAAVSKAQEASAGSYLTPPQLPSDVKAAADTAQSAGGMPDDFLQLGRALLQFAFALARGVGASLMGDPSSPEVKAQRMADIAQLVGSICQLLALPQDAHSSVLALQLEAVKVLVQMPLQATQADAFTKETLESGQAWSLAMAVHSHGGLAALLKIVHLGLMGVVAGQPLLLEQYWGGAVEGGGSASETSTPERPVLPVPAAFKGVSSVSMFPPVMLLQRLLSAEMSLRAAALPTVMQGSGFVALQSSVGSEARSDDGDRSAAPLLYDSSCVEGGAPAMPLFDCLKAAMQVNPPQDLLKRFAGEVLFMGAGGDPRRYVSLVGVGLALPMLQAAGLVEFGSEEGGGGAASSAAGKE